MRSELSYTLDKCEITNRLGRDLFPSIREKLARFLREEDSTTIAHNPHPPYGRAVARFEGRNSKLEICGIFNGEAHCLLSVDFNRAILSQQMSVTFHLAGTGFVFPEETDCVSLLQEIGYLIKHIPQSIHYDKFYRELIENFGAEADDALIEDLPEYLQNEIRVALDKQRPPPDSTCE